MFQRQITIEMNVNVINASLDVCCCVLFRLFVRLFACFVLFGVFFCRTPSAENRTELCIEHTAQYTQRANNCKLPFRFVKCVINTRLSHGRKCFKINNFWNATISNRVLVCWCVCLYYVLMMHLYISWKIKSNQIELRIQTMKLNWRHIIPLLLSSFMENSNNNKRKNRGKKACAHTRAWSHQSKYGILKALAHWCQHKEYTNKSNYSFFVCFVSFRLIFFGANLFRYNFHA